MILRIAIALIVSTMALAQGPETEDPFDAANILFWGHYNESQGATTFYDSSGNARNGSCPGTPTGCSACPTRGKGSSFFPYYSYSGTNQCINYGDQNSMENITAFSATGWIRSTTTGQTGKGLISKCDDTAGSWCFYVTGGNLIWWMNNAGGTSISITVSQATAFNGDWRHIVGTYDGTNARFWMDGTLVGTAALTTNINNNTDRFTVGAWDSANNTSWAGDITEVVIYNKTLTREAIQQMYFTTAMRHGLASRLRTSPFLWARWSSGLPVTP